MRRVLAVTSAVVIFVLSACAPGTEGPAKAANASVTPADARDVVAAALAASSASPFHLTERQQFGTTTLTIYSDGGTDAARVHYVWDQPKEPAFIAIGTDFYFKTDAKAAKPWLHLVRTKLGSGSQLPGLVDLGTGLTLLGGMLEAKSSGPNTYQGKIDLQRASDAADVNGRKYVNQIIKGSNELTTGMTFSLTLESGRVTQVRYELRTTIVEVKVSYGQDVLVTPPPTNQTREANSTDYTQW